MRHFRIVKNNRVLVEMTVLDSITITDVVRNLASELPGSIAQEQLGEDWYALGYVPSVNRFERKDM